MLSCDSEPGMPYWVYKSIPSKKHTTKIPSKPKKMPVYRIKCFYVHRYLRRLQGLNQKIKYVFLVFLKNISQQHLRLYLHNPPCSLQLKSFYWAANTFKGQWASGELGEAFYLSMQCSDMTRTEMGLGSTACFQGLLKFNLNQKIV